MNIGCKGVYRNKDRGGGALLARSAKIVFAQDAGHGLTNSMVPQGEHVEENAIRHRKRLGPR